MALKARRLQGSGGSGHGIRSILLAPGIYQRYLEKEYEIRATVIGDKIFSAKIKKKEGGSFVDWRFHLDKTQAVVEKIELSKDLENKIFDRIKILGLKYGCIDLVVSNDIPYFLEVNPSGQFLFIESFVPQMPLLAAFSSFVASGSESYSIHSADTLNINRFQESRDYEEMLKVRGKVMWENGRRSNI